MPRFANRNWTWIGPNLTRMHAELNRMAHALTIVLLFLLGRTNLFAAEDHVQFFEKHVRPVLAEHCWECHSEDAMESELRLDSLAGMLRGGTRGPAIVIGKPQQSLMIHAIRHSERLQMPPKRKLSARQIADLTKWIANKAVWPNAQAVVAQAQPTGYEVSEEDRDFWAFQPPQRIEPPAIKDSDWCRTPIDRFVLHAMAKQNLAPVDPVNKRKLIRRATFDLIGLPPAPAEVYAFLQDESENAFDKVLDRLLASPRYGERWGRHWLDVARYADSNGLDENLCYGTAFRYRDYVVRSFNIDKPFDQFVREQIAGDLIYSAESHLRNDGLVATGFLSLGPKMLAEDDPLKMQMDMIDEQVDTIGRAFLGMTFGCARCHDHKFDPIPTKDYYALAGIFKSTKTMDHFNVVARWQERQVASRDQLAELAVVDEAIGKINNEIQHLKKQASLHVIQTAEKHLSDYLIAASFAKSHQVPSASRQSIDSIDGALLLEAELYDRGNVTRDNSHYGKGIGVLVNHGETPNFVEFDLEFEKARRMRIEVRYAAAASRPCRLILNKAIVSDQFAANVTGGWMPEHQKWEVANTVDFPKGDSVLRLEQPTFFPHIDKLLLIPATGSTRLPQNHSVVDSVVAKLSTFLNDYRGDANSLVAQWKRLVAKRHNNLASEKEIYALARRIQFVYVNRTQDEDVTNERRISDADAAKIRHAFHSAENLESYYPTNLQTTLSALQKKLSDLKSKRPILGTAMAVSDYDSPEDLQVHLRGSYLTLGESAPRGIPQVFANRNRFPIGANASGRQELAKWLTDERNSLTARVIVNRIWQHHFVHGLVRSPDNFGRLGQTPTHPELLDWLAIWFIENGWQIKSLHRLMMNSSVYRLSANAPEENKLVDPENVWLSYRIRRRLEAEAIRDSLFAMTGHLDLRIGGTQLNTENRKYVTSTANVNPDVYSGTRRSIYLPIVRSAIYDVLQAFDFPDPSVIHGKRQSTTVAPQALFMMNSKIVAKQAEAFAHMLSQNKNERDSVGMAYEKAFAREPTASEVSLSLQFLDSMSKQLQSEGQSPEFSRIGAWKSFARAIFSSNEFIFVE